MLSKDSWYSYGASLRLELESGKAPALFSWMPQVEHGSICEDHCSERHMSKMRAATQEEGLGAELVNRYLHDMRTDVRRNRGDRKYIDVTSEGAPRFPGEVVPPDAQDDPELEVEASE
jgi:hypothetical protein